MMRLHQLFATLLVACSATFSGNIVMSNSEIQAVGVTYTFTLNFQTNIPANGKIVVRFPAQFTTSFTTTCVPVSGFTGSSLPCSYQSTTRMMTLTGAFPNTIKQIKFTAAGITNPMYVVTTDIFNVQSFISTGATYTLLETSGNNLKVTTTPGAITMETLILQNPTVGLSSVMTVGLRITHSIPANGQIVLNLPKWNGDDPDTSQWLSMIATSTSPGSVLCSPTVFVYQPFSSCILTEGTTSDTLVVSLNEANPVPVGASIQFLVAGVLAPPSQQPVKGFSFTTQTISSQQIDSSPNPDPVQLVATIPVQSSSQSVEVSAVPTSINFQSTITLSLQNLNPLQIGTNLKIVIPPEFNIVKNPLTVTTQGANINPSPAWTLNSATRTILIKSVNNNYLQQFDFMYITIAGVINPSQTSRTSSFQVSLYDSSDLEIEYVNQGVYFHATTGGFASITVSATNPYINAQDVGFTFTMVPENAFNSTAILKITFPQELYVLDGAYLTDVSQTMSTGTVKVNFNQAVSISGAFPNGYTLGDTFQFTLMGINNPPTTQPTHAILVSLFYSENTSEIGTYQGANLTFTAQPSTTLQMAAILDAKKTGQINHEMWIVGYTPSDMPIQKGSSLKVYIPQDFIINDQVRVAASCTSINGFTDEITCQFEAQANFKTGNTLWVYGGFDSSNFPGGNFTFSISEVQNPYSSQPTESFQMTVYDKYLGTEYIFPGKFTLSVGPSDFAYVQVQSSSPQNGVSSMIEFSITLGVDTPAGSILNLVKPNDLIWDDSKPFNCTGTMNIQGGLMCYKRNGISLNIVMMPDNKNRVNTFVNGTTIQISIGYIFNPISLAESGTWQVNTYTTSNGGTQYYYYNQKLDGLTITNTLRGTIDVRNITVYNNTIQLGKPTQIIIKLQSQNTIPAGSFLSCTIPTNFVVGKTGIIYVNGEKIQTIFQRDGYSYQIPINTANNTFSIFIQQGLSNPSTGPYSYDSFSFEFTNNNFAIDSSISYQTWISQSCLSNCATCKGNLTSCSSCGTDQTTGIASYKSVNLCLTQCPAGYFGGTGYQCIKCQSPCLQCDIGPTLCTQCDPSFGAPYASLETLQCYSTCPSGTYLDAIQGLCVLCESPCFTCTSATNCLSCDRTDPNNTFIHYFGLDQQCYQTCPTISVPSPSKICIECEAPCTTCTELPNMCTNCTEGLYLYKQQCVQKCPFGFYKDDSLQKCQEIAQLDIPFPFTILAILFSVLIGISHFLKGAGVDQKSTSFYITTLAFVDMLLRVNWIVLACLGYAHNYTATLVGNIVLVLLGIILNVAIWRRFFKFKYNMDDNDQAFVAYTKHYPKTAKVLLAFSYIISFQAVRLTYSKFLGKKQFMARFSRQKRYNRLIGQCSMLEIFFIYIPAIVLQGFEMSVYVQGDQIFYIGIDSLILVCYATILISIVVSQREPVMHPETLFEWKELLRFNVDSDPEVMYFDDVKNTENPTQTHNLVTESLEKSELEVQSAADFNEIKRGQQHLYQTEKRVTKPNLKATGKPVSKVKNVGSNQTLTDGFAHVDYNQYRLFEEKLNRVSLKKELYENKRVQDYNEVQKLTGEITTEQQRNVDLSSRMAILRKQLSNLKQEIEKVEMQRNDEVRSTEQRKRREIKKRSDQSQKPSNSPKSRKSAKSGSPPKPKSPKKKNGKGESSSLPIDTESSKIKSPQESPDRTVNRNLRAKSPEINKRSPKMKKKKREESKE